MPDLKMLNSTKYLYKLTFIKRSYGLLSAVFPEHDEIIAVSSACAGIIK